MGQNQYNKILVFASYSPKVFRYTRIEVIYLAGNSLRIPRKIGIKELKTD